MVCAQVHTPPLGSPLPALPTATPGRGGSYQASTYGRFLPGRRHHSPALLVEERRDPAPRVRRVDHVVDLAVGRHVQAAAVLVGRRDRRREDALALGLVLDRLQLAAHPEAHRALQAHAAELRRSATRP